MAKQKNGTVYAKYTKIKSAKSGAKACLDYVNDPAKTKHEIDSGSDALSYASGAINYVSNDEKTFVYGKHYVSGINCNPETAAREFQAVERAYHLHKTEALNEGHKANQAFHVIQSFKGQIDPDLAHELGCEFARRTFGDKHQAIVATHFNTDNTHNHIVANAYAMDGKGKFKDSYNVYKEFRAIANEISLEYGLPVFLNENDAKNRYRSWKEFSSTEEGKSWKQDLCNQLDEAIALSNTYEEVLKKMKEQGYEIQKNERSVTFKKDNVRVRDTRLGNKYTREGINQIFEKRELRAKREQIAEEVSKMRENSRRKTYPPVYIPRYDELGNRRSMLTRFLLMCKKIVEQAMNECYHEALEKEAQDNLNFKNAATKLKIIENTYNKVQELGVTDIKAIDMKIRDLYAKSAKYRFEISSLETFLENSDTLSDLIKQYEEQLPEIQKLGINIQDIIYRPDSQTIAVNRASLEPTTPKMRSDLYKALHDSGYCLSKKFNELTNSDAKEVLNAVRSHQKTDLPDGLTFGKPKKKRSITPASKPKFSFKNFDDDTRKRILEFKGIADQLAKYGLDSTDNIENFKENISVKTEDLQKARENNSLYQTEIFELEDIKKKCKAFRNPNFLYGPLYAGPTANLDLSLKKIDKERSVIDILPELQRQLYDLPNISDEELELMKLPIPEEYLFIRNLATVYPDVDTVRKSAKQTHELIQKIKAEKFLEKELDKELKKEWNEKLHTTERIFKD